MSSLEKQMQITGVTQVCPSPPPSPRTNDLALHSVVGGERELYLSAHKSLRNSLSPLRALAHATHAFRGEGGGEGRYAISLVINENCRS